MRSDMAKVIVERPRYGSDVQGTPKGYLRKLQRLGEEELPRREGMRRRWGSWRKGLNEHLGPLRRYLDAQVGRPWDLVFSEICAHIDRGSAVQDHVRDHVEGYVALHVILIDGVPCSGEGGWSYGRPLHATHWRRWYVCPRTGLLRRVEAKPRPRHRNPVLPQGPRFIRVSDSLQCRLIDGAWHVVTLKPLPLDRTSRRDRDVLLDRPLAELSPALVVKEYGAEVYAVALRRLSRRELRQWPIPDHLWT